MLDQVLAAAVVLLPTLFAVGIEVVSKEIKEHPVWRIAVLAFGVGISVLTWFQISRAAAVANREREQAIVETSERVSAKVSESVSKSVSKAVGEQYTQTINTLQQQIGTLQGKLETQGKNVEAIKGSNIVSGKSPIKVEVTNQSPVASGSSDEPLRLHAAAMPVAPESRYGAHATQMILTTNKRMNGAHLTIVCKSPLKQASATLLGSGYVIGGAQLADEHTVTVDIGNPDWSPDLPLVVTVHHDVEQIGACAVTPR